MLFLFKFVPLSCRNHFEFHLGYISERCLGMYSEWWIQDLKHNLHENKKQYPHLNIIIYIPGPETSRQLYILFSNIFWGVQSEQNFIGTNFNFCCFGFLSICHSIIFFWFVVVSLAFVVLCFITYRPLILIVLDWRYSYIPLLKLPSSLHHLKLLQYEIFILQCRCFLCSHKASVFAHDQVHLPPCWLRN